MEKTILRLVNTISPTVNEEYGKNILTIVCINSEITISNVSFPRLLSIIAVNSKIEFEGILSNLMYLEIRDFDMMLFGLSSSNTPSLKYLKIINCNLQNFLSTGINNNLEVLDLSNNKLKYFELCTMRYPSLIALILQNNILESITYPNGINSMYLINLEKNKVNFIKECYYFSMKNNVCESRYGNNCYYQGNRSQSNYIQLTIKYSRYNELVMENTDHMNSTEERNSKLLSIDNTKNADISIIINKLVVESKDMNISVKKVLSIIESIDNCSKDDILRFLSVSINKSEYLNLLSILKYFPKINKQELVKVTKIILGD